MILLRKVVIKRINLKMKNVKMQSKFFTINFQLLRRISKNLI